jgi:hypothetical protein
MKIAIIEVDHFQYGLTISELFQGHKKLFFTTPRIEKEMREYNNDLCDGTFHHFETIEKGEAQILSICEDEKIDLLFINPVFDSFSSVLKIVESIPCKKIITIHNWNYWLHPIWKTWKGWKERVIKRKIVEKCDYIAVEDFMYAYLKTEKITTFNRYKLLNIPFTLFHKQKKSFTKATDDKNLRVVLPGSIHYDRRRYEDIIEIIHEFAQTKKPITFSFAGKAIEAYGLAVIEQLKSANNIYPKISRFFDTEKEIIPDMFREEMETADIVLSTSTTKFKALGKTEYIGKTKPTAAIQDMLSFQLPGLLPNHLKVPKNLEGSVFNYENKNELKALLNQLMEQHELLKKWKQRAQKNSLHYTASEIRKTLPFFN